jgi:hypothetical protein
VPPAHEAQPPPLLAITRLLPLRSLLTAAKVEIIRRALGLAQRGQATGPSAWLIGRNISKRVSQFPQMYSYSGIESPRLFL